MTSETLFMEEIYNHSKLAETSNFFLIDHLSTDQALKWLDQEEIKDKGKIGLILEYCGGSIHRIYDAIKVIKQAKNLEAYLMDQAETYMGKIDHFIAKKLNGLNEKRMFKEILKTLLKQNYIIRDNENELQTRVLDKAVEYEFLFLNPKRKEIIFNSQIIKKGAELYFETT
jgi:hypothetical protein